VRRGAAHWLDGDPDVAFTAEPLRDLDTVSARVRELMGMPGR
jgi:hypothetical protein